MKKYIVAVISKNVKDFKLWKSENNITTENTTYINILTPCDLCSLSVNEIIETENAKENKDYDEIIICSKYNLIQ